MNKKIIVGVILISLLLSGYFLYSYISTPEEIKGLTEITGFNDTEGVSCLAVSPECGYCPGKVYEGSCYVDEKKLSDEEKSYVGL
jgi:hypothetical protein